MAKEKGKVFSSEWVDKKEELKTLYMNLTWNMFKKLSPRNLSISTKKEKFEKLIIQVKRATSKEETDI